MFEIEAQPASNLGYGVINRGDINFNVYPLGVYLHPPVSGDDHLDGTAYADKYSASGGADAIWSFGGDDTVFAGPGNDVVAGGAGDDSIAGGSGDDVIDSDYDFTLSAEGFPIGFQDSGGWGDDTVYGDGFDWPVTGDGVRYWDIADGYGGAEPGNDIIVTHRGSDTIHAGAGDDMIDPGPRGYQDTDIVETGTGADAVFFSLATGSGDPLQAFWTQYRTDYIQNAASKVGENFLIDNMGEFESAMAKALSSGLLLAKDVLASTAFGDLLTGLVKLFTEVLEAGLEPKPGNEDILVITDFDPSADVFFIPVSETTLEFTPGFLDSTVDKDLSGWGLTLSDHSGKVYAEVFLDTAYLAEFGITSSESVGAADLLSNVAATRFVLDENGIQNSATVNLLNSEAVTFAAASGTTTTAFGAFAPSVVVGPFGESITMVGGTGMVDALTVNKAFDITDPASQLNTGPTLVNGFGGDDLIHGGAGVDRLYGGDGNDTIYGNHPDQQSSIEEPDQLSGGAGNDSIFTGMSQALIDGGPDIDLLSFARSPIPVTASLADGSGFDGIYSWADRNYTITNIENLSGSPFADQLQGKSGHNIVSGGAGDDFVSGGAGNDTVNGGDGNDLLFEDGGSNSFRGGAGTDTLVLPGDVSTYAFEFGLTETKIVDAEGRAQLVDHDVERVRFGDGQLFELLPTAEIVKIGDVLTFDQLEAGVTVSDQYADLGVAVSTRGISGDFDPAVNVPMVFDSSNPSGDDTDLATYFNEMLLIISQDGDHTNPNDDRDGGDVVFDFAAPKGVSSLTLVDVLDDGGSDGIGAKIFAYDAAGGQIGDEVDVGGDGGDNAVTVVDLAFVDVSKLVVELTGSGALDDLVIA
ncbi:MAG: hypothetical protein R3D25_19535 [Geminicoccaceae bacterium]